MSPPRGFPEAEFRARLDRAQAAMSTAGLDALLLTTEPEIRYFTGFLTRFWESPTRPWFVVVPATGKPVAVIPQIGAALMARTWIDDIRTWNAPDYDDDGVTLLADALIEIVPRSGKIGVPSGLGTHIRMPLADWSLLGSEIGSRRFTGDKGIVAGLRAVKSPAEIAKLRHACAIAGRAFARVPRIAREGVPLDRVFRDFQRLCLEEGADWVGYLAGGAGPGGYGDVISPATERPLQGGDVLMLDTGVVWDGYWSDFDRNWAVGGGIGNGAHDRLLAATEAGFAAARPGARAADLYRAMDAVLGGGTSGRLGHGLGMQLTEGLSLIPTDRTRLTPGMVLTLEPWIATGEGRMMVHEEVIVITEDGAEWLSPRAQEMETL